MRVVLFCVLAAMALCGAANASAVVVDAYYRPDVAFPQYDKYWKFQKSDVTLASGNVGGTLHMFVQNTGDQPLTLRDARLEDVGLSEALAFQESRKYRRFLYPANIYFNKLTEKEMTILSACGEPVWWRFEPKTLNPGQIGELVVRVRNKPVQGISLGVVFGGIQRAFADVSNTRIPPRIEAICFDKGRRIAYLYAGSKPGAKPVKLLIDGTDVTSSTTFAADPKVSVNPITCKLPTPLKYASLHVFQVCYSDGSKTTASIRAFDDDFAYGMWGAVSAEAKQFDLARNYFRGLATHNINVQMEQIGSEGVAEYMKSAEGLKMMAQLGIRRMIAEPGKGGTTNPRAFFLTDEPDAGDSKIEGLPAGSRVGTLGRGLVERTFELRQTSPATPQLLNLDYTFAPENWYTYGQIADILTADPYYQGHIAEETDWGAHPEKLSLFTKPTYIAGIAAICQTSQAPRQANILLFTGRPEGNGVNLRYGTPQEKRIEAFYSIGSGIKGISYWWYHCLEEGLVAPTANPVAQAQWKEIGLLGAQLRTAGPVIMTSCPAEVPVSASPKVWSRTLVRGNDTLVLLLVNDDYSCDLKGINIKPLKNVSASVDLPSWLKTNSVFELTYAGTKDVKSAVSASKLTITAGQLDVGRMFVISSDEGLRARLQKLYDNQFAANVKKLLGK